MHFQSATTKNQIKYMQDKTRKQLVQTNKGWILYTKMDMCPYALWNSNDICNIFPDKEDYTSQL